MDKNMVNKALRLVREVHSSQKRDGGEPYHNHLVNVMHILVDTGYHDKPLLLQAALLHDTIEDTHLSYGEIMSDFGEITANIVREVSVDTRKTKKQREPEVLATAMTCSGPAIAVKLADMIDNLSDMSSWDEKRRMKYLKQKRKLFYALSTNDNFTFVTPLLLSRVEAVFDKLTKGEGNAGHTT